MFGSTDRSCTTDLVEALRLEDALSDEVVVGPTRRRLDHAPKHEIAGVRVGVAPPHRVERLAVDEADQLLRFETDAAVADGAEDGSHAVARRRRVVAEPRRMGEQVAHADLVVIRQAPVPAFAADPFRCVVVQRQHAVFHQEHRQRGHERLARAAARHPDGVVEGDVRLPVRKPRRGADDAAIREAHCRAQTRHPHLDPCFLEQRREFSLVKRPSTLTARQQRDGQAFPHVVLLLFIPAHRDPGRPRCRANPWRGRRHRCAK